MLTLPTGTDEVVGFGEVVVVVGTVGFVVVTVSALTVSLRKLGFR